MSVPSSLFIFSGSNGSTTSLTGFGYTSTIPSTTLPQPSSSISWQARLIACSAKFGSSPFTNFAAASVARPIRFVVRRIFVPSKQAASNNNVLMSSVTIEFSPPMIPAIPISFSPSQIIRTSLSILRSCPSSVTNVSPSLARFTTIFLPAIVSKSYACIG